MAYKYLNDDGLKAYTKKVKGALKDIHTPIAISSENTTESKAQNVRNIADFIAKAKAAGIADMNGMAVTCLIDNDYSAVLAFYSESNNTQQNMFGVSVHDDPSEQFVIRVSYDGYYTETPLVTPQNTNIITSEMLTRGVRRPIILTSSTTEVDEETYQKLISDDVDVMFKTDEGNLCKLTFTNFGISDTLNFTCLSIEGNTLLDFYIYGYSVAIDKNSPHICHITEDINNDFDSFLKGEGYLHQSTLSPVLQEIDLTGTDAERKAKLDQFEIDWKALTGASDLIGARFEGWIQYEGFDYCGVFVWNSSSNSYYAIIGNGTDGGSDSSPIIASITQSNGAIYISYLFYHLKPMTIKAGSTAADIAANKAAIKVYRKNLVSLGIYPNWGYQVSVVVTSNGEEYTGTLNIGTGALLSGIVTDTNETHHYPFHIEAATGIVTFDKTNYFLEKTSNEVTEMLDAIKYSYTQVPLTTTTSTNKTQLDLFLSKVPNAQVMHCTYKDVYAGTLHKINGSWYGVLVGESNTIAGQLSIKLQADGTIVEGTA